MPRPQPPAIPPDARPIGEIVLPGALEGLSAERQLAVWCAYHGTSHRGLAVALGVDQSQLARVRTGKVPSAPIVEAVYVRTGVRIGGRS